MAFNKTDKQVKYSTICRAMFINENLDSVRHGATLYRLSKIPEC